MHVFATWPSPATGLMLDENFAAVKRWISITDAPFNAVGDGVVDDGDAIQDAIDELYSTGSGSGAVYIPGDKNFKYTVAPTMRPGVDLFGDGYGSRLAPTGCSAFSYDFVTGFGNSSITGLNIVAVSGSAQVGIYQAGTLDDADELYGITVRDVLMRGFNVGMKFRTVRNVTLDNCWLQDCNSGIHLIGKCLVVNIDKLKIVKGAGSGTGASAAILCEWFDYTDGTGPVRPETVRIDKAHIYGFDTGVDLEAAVYAYLTGSDIQALVEGVLFEDVSATLSIDHNYIQIAGSNASCGIRGKGQSVSLDAKYNICNNDISAVSTAAYGTLPAGTTIGVMIGTAVSGKVENVTVADNKIEGNTLFDIANYLSGNNSILRNKCRSTAVTNSILTSGIPANQTVTVDDNTCAMTIGWDTADFSEGRLVKPMNRINGTTVDRMQPVPTVASAAALTLPQGADTFLISGTTSITSIVVTGWAGRSGKFIFSGALTLTDGGNIKAVGNFVTAANSTWSWTCDGISFYETGRSANG